MPAIKAVRRINGGNIESTSMTTVNDGELLGDDPLNQFAVETYTVDQSGLDAGPPWWANAATFRKATAEEAANFPAAQADDDGLLAVHKTQEGMDTDKQLRAIVAVLTDEVNALRERTRDNAQDVADATDLADLQDRWAAHAALDDTTKDMLIWSVKDAIGNG